MYEGAFHLKHLFQMILNTLFANIRCLDGINIALKIYNLYFQSYLYSCGGFIGRLSSVPWLLFLKRPFAGSSSTAHLLGLADSSNGSQICLFRQSKYQSCYLFNYFLSVMEVSFKKIIIVF